MRTSAITAAVLALSVTAGALYANDDFSALLADLSFGDAPTLDSPPGESLTVVQEQTLQDLEPVPVGLMMPGMLESTPHVGSNPGPQDSDLAAIQSPVPQVALMDPVPTQVQTPVIDFDAAFVLQEVPPVPVRTVGHHGNQGDCNDCGTQGMMVGVCRPRNPVQLPASTLYQYFRSHPCYTNVWDGYGINCGSHHKHLHGECDCFKNSGHGDCCDSKCDSCDK